MQRTALITGITGQDGSYLAELLLARGYRVVGVVRRTTTTAFERIAHLLERIELVAADLTDQHSVAEAVRYARPGEVYNLAAQSVPQASWQQPVLTGDSTGLGVARVLDAVRVAAPACRVYQASSSEIFGDPVESPQRETTPLRPRNPYGAAKAYAHLLTAAYRDQVGLFAAAGILFNHESPRRGHEFVMRKVSRAVARVHCGVQRDVHMGDLSARRDWGFAGDYMDAAWRIVQQAEPADYVVGTGVTHSVRELCEAAFGVVGRDYRDHVTVDPALVRGSEGAPLVADAARARERLGWRPTVTFERLVEMMVEADVEECRRELAR